MTKSARRKAARETRIRFVVQRAMRGYDELPQNEKVELLLGLAEVCKPLPGQEAEAARATAWGIQVSEKQQLKFRELVAPTS